MNKPILDPPIPYIGRVQTRFTPGKFITIEGTVPAVSYRFNINLQCGPQTAPQDDIALHISVQLLQAHIGLNSLQRGIWDDEQRSLTLPIKRAEKFEITLTCGFNCYKVAINGQHFCDFPQRIHYDRISHLAIDGDVSIIKISYDLSTSTEIGGASSNNFKIPRIPPLENPLGHFENVDAASPGMQPPSYESAVSARLPYSTDDSGKFLEPGVVHAPTVSLNAYPSSGHTEISSPPRAPVTLSATRRRQLIFGIIFCSALLIILVPVYSLVVPNGFILLCMGLLMILITLMILYVGMDGQMCK